MLDRKIYIRLGYNVSTSAVTIPTTAATTAQPSEPTSSYSTTSHIRFEEATRSPKELQQPVMEYSQLTMEPQAGQYDYVDSTITTSHPGIVELQHVTKELVLSSTIYETADMYEDVQSHVPLEYMGYEVPINVSTRQSAAGQPNDEEYSHLKCHY